MSKVLHNIFKTETCCVQNCILVLDLVWKLLHSH